MSGTSTFHNGHAEPYGVEKIRNMIVGDVLNWAYLIFFNSVLKHYGTWLVLEKIQKAILFQNKKSVANGDESYFGLSDYESSCVYVCL